MTTSTLHGFTDLTHNITVGPVAAECVQRELLSGGHRRIQPLNATTFDMTYPRWVMSGNKKRIIQAHHAELEQRIKRPAAPPCG